MSTKFAVFITLMVMTFSGCGGDGFTRLPVAGTVLMDGVAVPLADLSFIGPTGGPGGERPQSFGRIVNGKFSIPRERGPIAGPQRVHVVFLEEIKREFDPSNSEEQPQTAFRELGNARAEIDIPAQGTDSLRIELTKDSQKIANDS